MASFRRVREHTVILFILFFFAVFLNTCEKTMFFKSEICFCKSDKFTLLWLSMWFADCESLKRCLVTYLFLRALGCENALSFFFWPSSLCLWKRVKASTRLCSASSLMSFSSFSNMLSGVIFGFAVYRKDFG